MWYASQKNELSGDGSEWASELIHNRPFWAHYSATNIETFCETSKKIAHFFEFTAPKFSFAEFCRDSAEYKWIFP